MSSRPRRPQHLSPNTNVGGPGGRLGAVRFEAGQGAVAVRDDRVGDGPGYREVWVVPGDATLAVRAVEGVGAVQHVGRLVAQDTEAVSEAGRHPEQPAVQVAQFDAE